MIVIAGAGPTGLVAALVLTANGMPCRIIDKRTQAASSSRALGLQARSMEVLAGLGIADEVAGAAYQLSGASVMREDRELVRLPWVPPKSSFPYTYVLPQAGLEAILRRRLADAGVEVEQGVELTSITQWETKVTVQLADGRHIAADWLIGADGARSRVREQVGINFPGHDTGEVYYLADAVLRLDRPIQDSAMWLGPNGPLMLMRLPGQENLWRVFADVTDTAGESLPELTAPVLMDLLADRGPSGVVLERIDWTSMFRTRIGLAEVYRCGRVFLAGDAAHVFPPFGGQGMNLGIQDAVNLTWRLAAVGHGASAQLLDGYQNERRTVAAATIRGVERRRRSFAMRHPLARRLRDGVLSLGGRSRSAARSASLQNSQLSTSYARKTRYGSRPRVGDRAPEVGLAGSTLHRLFGPGHAALLLAATGGPDQAIVDEDRLRTLYLNDRTDPQRNVRRAYGLSAAGFVLVRPDGHIAARGEDGCQARPGVSALMGAAKAVADDGT